MSTRSLPWIALAALVVLVWSGAGVASEKVAKETGRECTVCHDKPGSKRLTDSGKYYEAMHTLDGFDEIKSSFGRCTTCHVNKPGSKKLTKKGQQLAASVKDMNELREWVKQNHPAAPAH